MKIFFLIVFTLLSTTGQADLEKILRNPAVKTSLDNLYRYPLAATMIFRDEAPYLKEWIEYHKLLGVKHFYLYNNLSQDNYLEVLRPYIKSGLVDLIEWNQESDGVPSWNAVQCMAYMNALDRARHHRVKWLAILDSDEFLVPRHEDSLVTFLQKYENDTIGGVRVLWVMFGTSNVSQIPADKTLIETLLLNEGYVSGMWKSIVRPDRANPGIMGGPHGQSYLHGCVDPILSTDVIQCNHYWTRDEYYLHNFKIPRRIIWGTPPDVCEQWKDYFNNTTPAGEPILRFVPKLRKVMRMP